jgi:sortase A
MRKQRRLLLIGSALVIGGATLLGSYFWLRHQADQVQRGAQQWLNGIGSPRPGAPVTTSPQHRLRRGAVVGELLVPRLHLAVMVFEGDDDGILKVGAGHIPTTPLPLQVGNVGIAAHRDTYFRPLRLIRPNDAISFKTPTGTFHYTVTNTEIVQPSDIQILARSNQDLTLVTCYPFYYVGSAPERFIVHAQKAVSKPRSGHPDA